MTLKIKVNIAGRQYPLSVEEENEEVVRNASKNIEALSKNIENGFEVNDKQDTLAMCALQLATKLESLKRKQNVEEEYVLQRINEMRELISESTIKNK